MERSHRRRRNFFVSVTLPFSSSKEEEEVKSAIFLHSFFQPSSASAKSEQAMELKARFLFLLGLAVFFRFVEFNY